MVVPRTWKRGYNTFEKCRAINKVDLTRFNKRLDIELNKKEELNPQIPL